MCQEKLLCLCQVHCTVFCSVCSGSAFVPRHFFPQTFLQPKCNKWERLHQDKWFYGVREVSSLINLCKTAAGSSWELGDLGIRYGDEGQSDWHGCCPPGWCAYLLCSQNWYSSQFWENQPKPESLLRVVGFEHIGSPGSFMGWLDEQQHKEGWDMAVEILVG